MKYFIKLTALAVALGLGFTACQKDYSPTPGIEVPDPQNPLSGSFTCMLDGQQFTAQTKTFNYNGDTKTLVMGGTKYADNKAPGVYQQIVITIPNYDGGKRYGITGAASITYISTDVSGSNTTYTSINNENYYVQTEGTYKGAFNVVVANTADNADRVVLSQGKFEFK
ncbi:MAG: hypothetical protein BGO31_17640 [Bacteroidetes bacterium 43-16]|nr:MAG: hypothetical protein BGO31_17640 [Bacteroidetes bacterium 43-16]